MDTKKPAADADNHNTNQNEADCANRCDLMMDQFQEPTFLIQDNPVTLNLEVNVTTEQSKCFPTMPTIIITPASPDLTGGAKNSNFNLQHSSEDTCLPGRVHEKVHDGTNLINMNLLNTPQTDTTLNIQRPPMNDKELSPMMAMPKQPVTCGDTMQEEDIDVMCRFSSTPVLSNARTSHSLDKSDCSMISISKASPIASGDTTVTTPNRSTNRSREDDQQDDNPCASNTHQNAMYVHPQYLIEGQGQSMVRRDAPVSQSVQPPYMAGRVIDTGYQPTASVSAGVYNGSQNVYSSYMEGTGCYNQYFPTRDSSWTDLSYRSDTSPVPPAAGHQTDPCCYPLTGASSEYFVYPSIYVSSSGLISVLLRNDMSVEMTVDRTIRVVSHNHMMSVATDSRGTAACLYHPAVKVFQIGTTTDIATLNFRARMGGDVIVFSNGVNFFKLEDSELQPTAPIKFTDIFRDQSVNLLFSSEGYGESLVASCMQVAAQAEYANLPKGGVIVRINGVKVTQTGGGDVTVVTGAKFIRLSPHFGTTRLGNRFVDIEVEKDWTVKLTRGSHSFVYSKKRAMVCNGKMEAGFDENNGLKVTNLQLRLPLLAEPSIVRRPCRKQVRVPSSSGTPKRRPGPAGTGRWNGMTSVNYV